MAEETVAAEGAPAGVESALIPMAGPSLMPSNRAVAARPVVVGQANVRVCE